MGKNIGGLVRENYRERKKIVNQSHKRNYGPTKLHTFQSRQEMRGRPAKEGNKKSMSPINRQGGRCSDGRARGYAGQVYILFARSSCPPNIIRTMVARFVNKSRPSLSLSRRSSSSSCAPVKRILGKQQRMAVLHQLRTPLSNKAAIVNRSSTTPPADMPTPLAATTTTTPLTSTRVRLPRTLPRPALREIDMSIIEEAFPHFSGVPAQYIRDKLAVVAPQ